MSQLSYTIPEQKAASGGGTPSDVASVLTERGSTYGPAGINLKCSAELIRAYTFGKDAALLHRRENQQQQAEIPQSLAHDEAIRMCLVKIARIATGYHHPDNYVDLLGYATLARNLAEGKIQ